MITLQELFKKGAATLRDLPRPGLEARILLVKAGSLAAEAFSADPGRLVPDKEAAAYERLLARRLTGEPLAYITGEKEFWSLAFRVGPGVLIPRPETELIVETVLRLSARGKERIIDLGTGSGNIAVSLAKELPGARITAADISLRALRRARENAAQHGVHNISFVYSRGFAGLKKGVWRTRYDFVVSNPPYISISEWENLPEEIRHHEPKKALVAGETGLEFIRKLIPAARPFLRPGGYLVFEIGFGQKDAVLPLFDKSWDEIGVENDLAGIPRVFAARRRSIPKAFFSAPPLGRWRA